MSKSCDFCFPSPASLFSGPPQDKGAPPFQLQERHPLLEAPGPSWGLLPRSFPKLICLLCPLHSSQRWLCNPLTQQWCLGVSPKTMHASDWPATVSLFNSPGRFLGWWQIVEWVFRLLTLHSRLFPPQWALRNSDPSLALPRSDLPYTHERSRERCAKRVRSQRMGQRPPMASCRPAT